MGFFFFKKIFYTKTSDIKSVTYNVFMYGVVYKVIILIELKYIVSMSFDWTRILSPVFFYSFITR